MKTAKLINFWLLCSLTVCVSCGQANNFTNDIGMEFVLIPAGSFIMGSDTSDSNSNETPAHKVTISKSFYMGKYEVTQKQWEDVMGKNPSYFEGPDNPVEGISWNDIQVFVERLNHKESRGKYRLPTEAEWEYAARAGTSGTFFFGDNEADLDRYAWHRYNSGNTTHIVGLKEPNPWGLYDIYGNVDEWVYDGHFPYQAGEVTDPVAHPSGYHRVIRGGSWNYTARECRSAYRFGASERGFERGFRLVFSPNK